MDKFIEWVTGDESPTWLIFPFIGVCVGLALSFIAINVVLLVNGLWPFLAIIWLIIPSYVLYQEYSKHNGGNK